MIIKSHRRKSTDFMNLIDYINRDGLDTFAIRHNLRGNSNEEIAYEFTINDQYRKAHTKVTMYHEIVSFSAQDSPKINEVMAKAFTRLYIRKRGDKALCFAKVHNDTEHLHIHFAFSGIEYKSPKSLRLNNQDFMQLRRDMEAYQKQHYPELNHSLVYQQDKKLKRGKQANREREYQVRKRTGHQSRKEQVQQKIKQLYAQAQSQTHFYQLLKTHKVATYQRNGKAQGVFVGKRKYSFINLLGKAALIRLDKPKNKVAQRLQTLQVIEEEKKTQHLVEKLKQQESTPQQKMKELDKIRAQAQGIKNPEPTKQKEPTPLVSQNTQNRLAKLDALRKKSLNKNREL